MSMCLLFFFSFCKASTFLSTTLIQLQEESFPCVVKRYDKTLDKNPYGENSSVQGLQPCESTNFYCNSYVFSGD